MVVAQLNTGPDDGAAKPLINNRAILGHLPDHRDGQAVLVWVQTAQLFTQEPW